MNDDDWQGSGHLICKGNYEIGHGVGWKCLLISKRGEVFSDLGFLRVYHPKYIGSFICEHAGLQHILIGLQHIFLSLHMPLGEGVKLFMVIGAWSFFFKNSWPLNVLNNCPHMGVPRFVWNSDMYINHTQWNHRQRTAFKPYRLHIKVWPKARGRS